MFREAAVAAVLLGALALGMPPTDGLQGVATASGRALFGGYVVTLYPATVEVSSNATVVGMANDQDKLNFGVLPLGGSYSRRFVDVTNDAPRAAEVRFRATGAIGGLVELPAAAVLAPGERRSFAFKATSWNATQCGGACEGVHRGVIEVSVFRPVLGPPVV